MQCFLEEPRYSERGLHAYKGTLYTTDERAFAQRGQDALAKVALYLATLTGNGASDSNESLVVVDVGAHAESGEQWTVDKMVLLEE